MGGVDVAIDKIQNRLGLVSLGAEGKRLVIWETSPEPETLKLGRDLIVATYGSPRFWHHFKPERNMAAWEDNRLKFVVDVLAQDIKDYKTRSEVKKEIGSLLGGIEIGNRAWAKIFAALESDPDISVKGEGSKKAYRLECDKEFSFQIESGWWANSELKALIPQNAKEKFETELPERIIHVPNEVVSEKEKVIKESKPQRIEMTPRQEIQTIWEKSASSSEKSTIRLKSALKSVFAFEQTCEYSNEDKVLLGQILDVVRANEDFLELNLKDKGLLLSICQKVGYTIHSSFALRLAEAIFAEIADRATVGQIRSIGVVGINALLKVDWTVSGKDETTLKFIDLGLVDLKDEAIVGNLTLQNFVAFAESKTADFLNGKQVQTESLRSFISSVKVVSADQAFLLLRSSIFVPSAFSPEQLDMLVKKAFSGHSILELTFERLSQINILAQRDKEILDLQIQIKDLANSLETHRKSLEMSAKEVGQLRLSLNTSEETATRGLRDAAVQAMRESAKTIARILQACEESNVFVSHNALESNLITLAQSIGIIRKHRAGTFSIFSPEYMFAPDGDVAPNGKAKLITSSYALETGSGEIVLIKALVAKGE